MKTKLLARLRMEVGSQWIIVRNDYSNKNTGAAGTNYLLCCNELGEWTTRWCYHDKAQAESCRAACVRRVVLNKVQGLRRKRRA